MLPCCVYYVSTAFKVTLVKGRSPRAGIAGTWGRKFEMGPELRGAPGSAMLLGGVFTIACALAKDIQTLIIVASSLVFAPLVSYSGSWVSFLLEATEFCEPPVQAQDDDPKRPSPNGTRYRDLPRVPRHREKVNIPIVH